MSLKKIFYPESEAERLRGPDQIIEIHAVVAKPKRAEAARRAKELPGGRGFVIIFDEGNLGIAALVNKPSTPAPALTIGGATA